MKILESLKLELHLLVKCLLLLTERKQECQIKEILLSRKNFRELRLSNILKGINLGYII